MNKDFFQAFAMTVACVCVCYLVLLVCSVVANF